MSLNTFIPKIWSARLLFHLDNALVASNFFNSNWEGEIRDQGDTVKINQISNPNIIPYQRNVDLPAPENLNTIAQELVIDQAEAFNFQVDDIDRVQTRADLMDEAMMRAGYQLGMQEDKFLFGRMVASTGSWTNAGALANFEELYELIVHLRTLMNRNNVPVEGRQLAVPPEATALLLKDPRFVQTGSAQAENRLATAQIGRIAGFVVHETNVLDYHVTNEPAIIAGHAAGATLAHQIVKTEAFRMERRFGDGLKGLNVYGARITHPEMFSVATFSI